MQSSVHFGSRSFTFAFLVVCVVRCGGSTPATEPSTGNTSQREAARVGASDPNPAGDLSSARAMITLEVNFRAMREVRQLAEVVRAAGRSTCNLDGMSRFVGAVGGSYATGLGGLSSVARFDREEALPPGATPIDFRTCNVMGFSDEDQSNVTFTEDAPIVLRVQNPTEQTPALQTLVHARAAQLNDAAMIGRVTLAPDAMAGLTSWLGMPRTFSEEDTRAVSRAHATVLQWNRDDIGLSITLAQEDAPQGASIARALEELRTSGLAYLTEIAAGAAGESARYRPIFARALEFFRAATFANARNTVRVTIPMNADFVGELAAIGVPAFRNYIAAAKAAEARSNIEALTQRVAEWGAAHPPVRRRLPPLPSAPLTPATVPTRPAVDPPGTWTGAWEAISFEISDSHSYSYALVTRGNTITIQARGDLDADGTLSLFERVGTRDPRTGTLTFGEITVTDELD